MSIALVWVLRHSIGNCSKVGYVVDLVPVVQREDNIIQWKSHDPADKNPILVVTKY